MKTASNWTSRTLQEVGLPRTKNIDPAKSPNEVFELYSVPAYSNGEPDIILGARIGSTKQVVEPGDVLLCKIVPHLNRVWVVPPKRLHRQVASGEWIVLRSSEHDASYIRRALMEPGFRDKFMETVSGVGGSLLRARPQLVSQIKIALAPANEQRRIVAKLDSVLAKSKAAREELDHLPKLAERYKQAVLAAAFRGELTELWRGEGGAVNKAVELETVRQSLQKLGSRLNSSIWKPRSYDAYPQLGIPSVWKQLRVGDIAIHRSGLAFKSERFSKTGIQVLRLGNLYQGKLDLNRSPIFLDDVTLEESTSATQPGDILISQTGTRFKRDYGRFVQITPESTGLMVNQRILCLSLSTEVTPQFLTHFSNTSAFREFFFAQETGGVNQGNVGVAGVMDAPCPLPSLAEQNEIVRQIDISFDHIDSVCVRTAQSEKLLARLEEFTLSKAFRGELAEPPTIHSV